MQISTEQQAAVDFVTEAIAYTGNVLSGDNGQIYFIDDVVFIGEGDDSTLVVVSNNSFYVLCIKGTEFFVLHEYSEAANDPRFWCACAA